MISALTSQIVFFVRKGMQTYSCIYHILATDTQFEVQNADILV
jgi:hypothetical protein